MATIDPRTLLARRAALGQLGGLRLAPGVATAQAPPAPAPAAPAPRPVSAQRAAGPDRLTQMAEAARSQQSSGPTGIGGILAKVGKTALKPLEFLDLGRRAAVLGFEEITNTNQDDTRSNMEKLRDASYGFGDLLDPEGSKWLNRVLGFTGDVLLDPLTYVTLGTGRAAGLAGRMGAAADLTRIAGVSDDLIERVAQRGVTGLSRAERSAVNAARVGEGLSSYGDAGLRFMGARIPGTGGVATGVGNALASTRQALTGGRVGDVLRAAGAGRDPLVREAVNSAQRGGQLSAREAVNLFAARSADKGTSGLFGHNVRALGAELEGRVNGQSIDSLGAEDAAALRAWQDAAREEARKLGVDIGELEDFQHHTLTAEGRELLNKNGGDIVIDESAASGTVKARTLVPREKPYRIGDGLVKIDEGDTISTINRKVREANPEFQGNLFSEDAGEIMRSYVSGLERSVGRSARLRRLEEGGSAFREGGEGWTTKVDKKARKRAETDIKARVEALDADTASVKTTLNELSAEIQRSVVAARQGVLDANQRVLTDTGKDIADAVKGAAKVEATRAKSEAATARGLAKIDEQLGKLDERIAKYNASIRQINAEAAERLTDTGRKQLAARAEVGRQLLAQRQQVQRLREEYAAAVEMADAIEGAARQAADEAARMRQEVASGPASLLDQAREANEAPRLSRTQRTQLRKTVFGKDSKHPWRGKGPAGLTDEDLAGMPGQLVEEYKRLQTSAQARIRKQINFRDAEKMAEVEAEREQLRRLGEIMGRVQAAVAAGAEETEALWRAATREVVEGELKRAKTALGKGTVTKGTQTVSNEEIDRVFAFLEPLLEDIDAAVLTSRQLRDKQYNASRRQMGESTKALVEQFVPGSKQERAFKLIEEFNRLKNELAEGEGRIRAATSEQLRARPRRGALTSESYERTQKRVATILDELANLTDDTVNPQGEFGGRLTQAIGPLRSAGIDPQRLSRMDKRRLWSEVLADVEVREYRNELASEAGTVGERNVIAQQAGEAVKEELRALADAVHSLTGFRAATNEERAKLVERLGYSLTGRKGGASSEPIVKARRWLREVMGRVGPEGKAKVRHAAAQQRRAAEARVARLEAMSEGLKAARPDGGLDWLDVALGKRRPADMGRQARQAAGDIEATLPAIGRQSEIASSLGAAGAERRAAADEAFETLKDAEVGAQETQRQLDELRGQGRGFVEDERKAAVDKVQEKRKPALADRRTKRAQREELLTKASTENEKLDSIAAWQREKASQAINKRVEALAQADELAAELKAAKELPSRAKGGQKANVAAYRKVGEDLEKAVAAARSTQDEGLLANAELLSTYTTGVKRIEANEAAKKAEQGLLQAAKDGTLPNVVRAVAADGFQLLGKELIGEDLAVRNAVARALRNFDEVTRDPEWLRAFDTYTRFFKTWATTSPGFHVRNGMSATFMNASDGVTPKSMIAGVRLAEAYRKGGGKATWAAHLPANVREKADDIMRAVFGSGASGQYSRAEIGRPLRTKANAAQKAIDKAIENPLTDASRRLGSHVEMGVRAGMAYDTIMRGGSVEEAIERIRRIHFDYSEVSGFDRVAKKIIPFWTFMSRNLPLQVQQMWLKPRVYAQYASLVRNFDASEDGEMLPIRFEQRGGFKIADGIGLSPDLPHTRLDEEMAKFTTDPVRLLADANPALRIPAELVAGRRFYNDLPFAEEGTRAAEARTEKGVQLAPFMPLLQVLGFADSEGNVDEKASYVLSNLLPPVATTQRLLGQGDYYDDRVAASNLRWWGVPVDDLGPEAVERERKRRERASN